MRLEQRSGVNGSQPRKVLSIVVTRLDREPSPETAECKRTLYPDGTVIEVVRLDR